MYLHLGEECIIPFESIVGIFDLDNVTATRGGRSFLQEAERAGRVRTVSETLPRSFVIAVENGRVVGYLDVTWPKEKNYIFDILVEKDSRCRGWGRKLLARAIEMNRPGGMALDVNVDNTPARHLYEAMGFTRVEGKNKITATVQLTINN